MTTYLATETRGDLTGESYALAFCSPECRRDDQRKKLGAKFRDDDSYEFDEVCANCGAFIPASGEPLLQMDETDRRNFAGLFSQY